MHTNWAPLHRAAETILPVQALLPLHHAARHMRLSRTLTRRPSAATKLSSPHLAVQNLCSRVQTFSSERNFVRSSRETPFAAATRVAR